MRLVVVWMAGALALAIGVRVHSLRHASPSPPATSLPPPRPLPVERAIADYLRGRYDEVDYRDDGYVVMGLAYVPEEAPPLLEIENEALRRFLPDTRFFKTALAAPFMEYRHVETLVSFRRTAGRDDIRSCLSPTYGSASGAFLSQFHGVNVSTPEARRALALGIAQLLAEATFRGRARPPTTTVVEARAELWHGRLHWRDIDVLADCYGRVDRVFIH